ncbi:peptide chain release factor N(5)-glutamine methyltransferase [Alphaproteobacteria bacterium]|jgi:release factor glutamine methyltransferase|nr:peptide chain release factor N(5)-glutamine methyltransferase [Alphaproteobacteria bacterium]
MIKKKLDVFSLIKSEIEVLKKSGSETASLDCRLLLSFVLEKKSTLYTHENVYITDDEIKNFKVLISERSLGKPVSRIINKRNFWKRDFKLNEEVLDPRQDTEVLITAVLKYYSNIFDKLDILDLGSGSGCIGLSLLEELKNSNVSFLDVSKKSLEIVKINATEYNLEHRSAYFQLNWNSKNWDSDLLKFRNKSKFDIIVTNPPYIPTDEIKSLQREVKDFDPFVALDGGLDGLMAYKTIFPKFNRILKNGSKIFVEIGMGQEDMVIKIGYENNLLLLGYEKDLSGIVRVIVFMTK